MLVEDMKKRKHQDTDAEGSEKHLKKVKVQTQPAKENPPKNKTAKEKKSQNKKTSEKKKAQAQSAEEKRKAKEEEKQQKKLSREKKKQETAAKKKKNSGEPERALEHRKRVSYQGGNLLRDLLKITDQHPLYAELQKAWKYFVRHLPNGYVANLCMDSMFDEAQQHQDDIPWVIDYLKQPTFLEPLAPFGTAPKTVWMFVYDDFKDRHVPTTSATLEAQSCRDPFQPRWDQHLKNARAQSIQRPENNGRKEKAIK
jgi:hypothetical protein